MGGTQADCQLEFVSFTVFIRSPESVLTICRNLHCAPAGPVVCMEEKPVQSVMDMRELAPATARHRCTKADWAWVVAAVLEGRCADCESVTWVLDDHNT